MTNAQEKPQRTNDSIENLIQDEEKKKWFYKWIIIANNRKQKTDFKCCDTKQFDFKYDQQFFSVCKCVYVKMLISSKKWSVKRNTDFIWH